MSNVCCEDQCPLACTWLIGVPVASRCVAVAPLSECALNVSVSMPHFCIVSSNLFASLSDPRHMLGSFVYRSMNMAGLCKCRCMYSNNVVKVIPLMLNVVASPFFVCGPDIIGE